MDTQRYFIKLSYSGTAYHGWQYQPNAITVQEVINKAVSLFLKENIEVMGCGRTDTGVHASQYFAHFDTVHIALDTNDLALKLNRFLPRDIAIQAIFKVSNHVSSRFDAVSRTYHYHIQRYKYPFNIDFAYYYTFALDLASMQKAASLLFEYTDFTSFSKLHTDVKTNNCKIFKAEICEIDGQMVFEIQADRFLRNMVRCIVGTLIEIGKGKYSIANFRRIIESKDRSNAGFSVPAKGLFLTQISYPRGIVPNEYA